MTLAPFPELPNRPQELLSVSTWTTSRRTTSPATRTSTSLQLFQLAWLRVLGGSSPTSAHQSLHDVHPTRLRATALHSIHAIGWSVVGSEQGVDIGLHHQGIIVVDGCACCTGVTDVPLLSLSACRNSGQSAANMVDRTFGTLVLTVGSGWQAQSVYMWEL